MNFQVKKEHKPDTDTPLIAKKGDRFHWEKKATLWEGWLWCTSRDGISGWIPEAWLICKGSSANLTRDYDATELSVHPGETVTGELEASGWVWVKNQKNKQGWVPLDCLESL
jgi:hypothetical protein